MNRHIVYTCSLLFIFNCSDLHSGKDDKKPPIIVNVRVENINEPLVRNQSQNNIQLENNSSSSSMSNAESTLNARFEKHIKKIMDLPIRDFAHSMQSNVIQYKRKLIIGATGGAYLTICAFLIFGNQFVNRSNTWTAWKKHLSMDEMQKLSQDKLGRDLIHTIQQRHVNVQNPTDHITPLVRFIQAVEYEERILNRYITLASTLKLCHVTIITPTNDTKIERAREARRRLMFVKHIFISWTATDNLKNFN